MRSGGSWRGRRNGDESSSLPLRTHCTWETNIRTCKSILRELWQRRWGEIFKGGPRKNIKITKQSIRNQRRWWKCCFSCAEFPRGSQSWADASQVSRVNAWGENCNHQCFLPLLNRRVSRCSRRAKTLSWPSWLGRYQSRKSPSCSRLGRCEQTSCTFRAEVDVWGRHGGSPQICRGAPFFLSLWKRSGEGEEKAAAMFPPPKCVKWKLT